MRCGGAATNLAAAVRKILITVAAIGFLVIIKVSLVHEVNWLNPLLGELGLVSANILAESNVVLLEEIMIIQGRTIFEAMLSPTCNSIWQTGGIWIFPNCQHCSMTVVIGEHVAWSVFSIRHLNLQKINASFLAICERFRNIVIISTLITIAVLLRAGPVA